MTAPAIDNPAKTLRIFLVENHRDTLEYMHLYLEAGGHTVLSADSMTRALAALPQADCGVLISDIGLPDGDGWTLLRRVQLAPYLRHRHERLWHGADQLKSQEAGYRHHLLKPIDPAQLDAALDTAARELT